MLRRMFAVLALTALAGCGGSDSPTTPVLPSAAGSWTLSTVNGSPLPYTLAATGANKTELTAGALTVVAGGSYTLSLSARSTINGGVTTSSIASAGTATATGTAITLRSNSDGSTFIGSFTASSLTIVGSGGAFVFTR